MHVLSEKGEEGQPCLNFSFWRTAWPFIRTNVNSLYSGVLCAKFSYKNLSGSEENDHSIKVNIYFHYFITVSSLKKPWLLKKFKSHSQRHAYCAKFGCNLPRGSEKMILKSCQ